MTKLKFIIVHWLRAQTLEPEFGSNPSCVTLGKLLSLSVLLFLSVQ